MATIWIRLTQAFAGYPANTVLAIDDKHQHGISLINAGEAVKVSNPGGTPPVYNPLIPVNNEDAAVQALLNNPASATAALVGRTVANVTAGAPTVANGAQASATTVVAGSADTAGSVTATALASGMAAGVVAVVSFGTAFAAAPKAVVLHERSAVAVGLYVSAKTSTGFTISSRSAATASQALSADFVVVG